MQQACGFALTFFAVVVAMVLFRGPTPQAAMEVLHGMFGLNGLTLPEAVFERLGPATGSLIAADTSSARDLVIAGVWVCGLLIIALLLPNSLEILSQYRPVLEDVEAPGRDGSLSARFLRWRPSPAWAILLSGMIVAAILRLGGESEFLYWQF